MKNRPPDLPRTLLLVVALGLLSVWDSNAQSDKPAVVPPALASPAKSEDVYYVRAGGPCVVPTKLKGSPTNNPVSITFASTDGFDATFRLTNREPVAILVWNVRVQVKVKDGGTDGQGWKTVHDDYPSGMSGAIATGAADQIIAREPSNGRWRVCVIYSKERFGAPGQTGRQFAGNFEIISQELTIPED
jgi:hypothetical protein